MTSSRILITLRRNLQRVAFPVRVMILATVVLFITLTGLDLIGVPGGVLVAVGVLIWVVGVITAILIWTVPAMAVGVFAIASERTANAGRWAFALSTSVVAWVLILGVIPFEENPESMVWIVAILIFLLGVLAIPWSGGVKAFLVFVLLVALALALAAAFGITRNQVTSQASQAWGVVVDIFSSEESSPSEEVALAASIPTTTLAPTYIFCMGAPDYVHPPELQRAGGMYEATLQTDCNSSYIVTPDEPGGRSYFEAVGGCIWFRFQDGTENTSCPGDGNARDWGYKRGIFQFRAIDPGAGVRVVYAGVSSP